MIILQILAVLMGTAAALEEVWATTNPARANAMTRENFILFVEGVKMIEDFETER